uniref:PAP fibrillin domain-containing protein n=1 Tax=Leersia perrieri TaxID=77586 RepID=A0A0D9UW59_9ORYZ
MAALSASLLRPPSTFAPVLLSPLQSHRNPSTHLPLRVSPHRRCRRRLVSLAASSSSAASPDLEKEPSPSAQQEKSPDLSAVAESVKVLKEAAKTRKVPAPEVLSALGNIKKAKLDTSTFFQTLGGTESPGRTWMLIFTAKGRLEKGQYFPVTAIQRFDAAGKRIENGVYLGPVGALTFEGRLSWKKKILAFIFERVRIKVGPFGPLEIGLRGGDDDREPSTKDPFFVWFYVDEEIAVAQGRGGGVAYWCRCKRVP